MVDFVRLQSLIKDRLEQDRNINTVMASGDSLEEAVAEASALLDIPVRRIDFEVTEKGSSGFLGQKKKWTIKAYERIVIKKEEFAIFGSSEELFSAGPVVEDVDGDVFLHLSTDGAYLKVIPPKGNGRKIQDADAHRQLQHRFVRDYDAALISRVVADASGEYVRVGSFEHKVINDSTITAEISDDEMKAYMVVTPPGIGGCDLSYENYYSFLKINRIVIGIKEDFLREFADRPSYKSKVVVAEGIDPVNGRSAYIKYNFETNQNKVKLREGSDGRVDFKDISIIENVVANQPLARKMPAEKGKAGRTVTGKFIEAKDGRDISLPLGKNVHVGEDGVTILSDLSGHVMLVAGNINVEPVHIVNGDVGVKTGNISLMGTVIVNGNVEVGFRIKATGNIEIKGTVEKAELDADGDITVHQGITGKTQGCIRAGNSIIAKFIENSRVVAGNTVWVSDGIINSQVDANRRIICRGKRASSVGGRLRATEEINAKVLGSPTSGTETVCEVGVDPQSKVRLETLQQKKAEMEKQCTDLERSLQTLLNIKKQRKILPEAKEASIMEMTDRVNMLKTDIMKNAEESAKIQEYMNSMKTRSRVSVSAKVYPGVKIIIRDAVNIVKNDYKAVTFILEDDLVRITKYEEPVDEPKRPQDGYSAY
jgi:uncharacterized protein (DUF342 family)